MDCEKCQTRKATIDDDDDLRKKVAKELSEMGGMEISPDSINCEGCRIDGIKTMYCESMCPVRQCALSKGIATCGECGEFESCEKLRNANGNSEDALENLRNRKG